VARECASCGKHLGMFHRDAFCADCEEGIDALYPAVEEALADDVLTADEDARLTQTIEAAGFTWSDLRTRRPDVGDHLLIALANDGRLPTVDGSALLVGGGEVVHLVRSAALMSEHAVREWRGRTSGISVPIGHGVRYRTGAIRGHSVVVGTQMVATDSGTLYVTSKRLVFSGAKSTIDIPLAKLVEVNAYSDGVSVHASNRKTAPLFRVASGPPVAAVLSAAAQEVIGG
jgi:hypothetical protein